MRILFFTDVHWSTNTSIVRGRGKKYSTRLELLIKSLNWLNSLATKESCDAMICLGDFFDKSVLTDEEISALREIKWNKLPTYYLVGNHESSVASLDFSTVDLFRNKRVEIVSKVKLLPLDTCQILFLPYITEDNRLPLYDYMKDLEIVNKKLIVCSHNELKGINYGAYESKVGFDIEDIKVNCSLFLNGHLHNGEWVSKNILNLGSLSAHNFTNDSLKYEYGVWILDTEAFEMSFYENPYSLNFYKLEINKKEDLKVLSQLKNNAVVSIRCLDEFEKEVRELINNSKAVLEHKIIIYSNKTNKVASTATLEAVDHLKQFQEFILQREDIDLEVAQKELIEVCK